MLDHALRMLCYALGVKIVPTLQTVPRSATAKALGALKPNNVMIHDFVFLHVQPDPIPEALLAAVATDIGTAA